MIISINKPTLIALSMFMIIFASCNDNFEDINTPPDSVTQIDPGLLLSKVEKDMMYTAYKFDYWKINTMTYGAWIQHWGVADHNFSPPYYIPTQDWFDFDWELTFTGLKQLVQAEKLLVNSVDGNRDDPNIRTKIAVIKVLNVYLAERKSALVGDIPYFEAVNGLSGNITPAFDKQEDLYPAFIDTLDKYIGKLSTGDVDFGSSDLIYGGDVEEWKKFGNSLKLRIGMRMKYANPSLAETVVTEAMNSSLISNNEESASVPTSSGGGPDEQANPLLAIYRTPAGKSMLGEALVNTLKAKNDPRLSLIAEPTANSKDTPALEYQGIPPAMTAEEADQIVVQDYSFPSSSIFVNEDLARPMKVLMYPEVAFLQAEAALEGWGSSLGEAEGFYKNGMESDLSRFPYNISQGEIDNYLSNEGTLSGTPEQRLEQIMTQKWLSFFDQEKQAFIEWRRTGYPQLNPGSAQGNTGGTIPRRGLYGQSEQSLNEENYQTAIDYQGPDNLTTKIWIDAKE